MKSVELRVRVPQAMRDRVKAEAARRRRTVSAEVATAIERFYAGDFENSARVVIRLRVPEFLAAEAEMICETKGVQFKDLAARALQTIDATREPRLRYSGSDGSYENLYLPLPLYDLLGRLAKARNWTLTQEILFHLDRYLNTSPENEKGEATA